MLSFWFFISFSHFHLFFPCQTLWQFVMFLSKWSGAEVLEEVWLSSWIKQKRDTFSAYLEAVYQSSSIQLTTIPFDPQQLASSAFHHIPTFWSSCTSLAGYFHSTRKLSIGSPFSCRGNLQSYRRDCTLFLSVYWASKATCKTWMNSTSDPLKFKTGSPIP